MIDVAQSDIHIYFAWQTWHLWHWVGALGPGLATHDAAVFYVAGVTLGDMPLYFTGQIWDNLTSTAVLRGKRDTYGIG